MSNFIIINSFKVVTIIFEITDNNPTLQLKIYKNTEFNEEIFFLSKKLLISKDIIEDVAIFIKSGSSTLNIKRVEFKDIDKSYIIIFDQRRQITGRAFNTIHNKMEEFHFNEIDRVALSSYLNSVVNSF